MTNIKMSFGRPSVPAQHPWPEGVFLQGGESGLVVSAKADGGSYVTAFVEAFSDGTGFIRGQGVDLATAEHECWVKAQHVLDCPGHEWESRGYKNGGGFCIHCNRFHGEAFTPEQLGLYCAACGVPTFWNREEREGVDEFFTCPLHVPHVGRQCHCVPCQAKFDQRDVVTDKEIGDALAALFGPTRAEEA